MDVSILMLFKKNYAILFRKLLDKTLYIKSVTITFFSIYNQSIDFFYILFGDHTLSLLFLFSLLFEGLVTSNSRTCMYAELHFGYGFTYKRRIRMGRRGWGWSWRKERERESWNERTVNISVGKYTSVETNFGFSQSTGQGWA